MRSHPAGIQSTQGRLLQRRHGRRLTQGWLVLSVAGVLAAGCGSPEAEVKPTAGAKTAIAAVETVAPEAVQLSRPITAQGTIAALQRSAIGTLVQGPVDRVFVRVGDRVARGQPLFRIRGDDYRRRQAEAQAALDLARAQALQTEKTHQRVQALKSGGYVSPARVDDSDAALAVARARVRQAEAAAETAGQALRDTVVRAPYDGVITGRMVDEGVFLSTFGAGGAPPVVEVQQVGVVAAIVNLPQDRIGLLRRNQPAKLFIEGFSEPFDSIVAVLNDRVDPQARTAELRLPIRNPGYAVKPGLSVRAEFATQPSPALVIPRRAVAGDSAAAYVFVVDGGIARMRRVKLREVDFDRMEVLSGLTRGERIVYSPAANLLDGARVNAKPDAPARQDATHVAR